MVADIHTIELLGVLNSRILSEIGLLHNRTRTRLIVLLFLFQFLNMSSPIVVEQRHIKNIWIVAGKVGIICGERIKECPKYRCIDVLVCRLRGY